eukprot:COSAG02_NODE_1529_length_12087_cov_326.174258_2_plen_159_part_00
MSCNSMNSRTDTTRVVASDEDESGPQDHDAGRDEFEVEAIVDERRVDMGAPSPAYEYLVRWQGCGEIEDMWYAVGDLQGCTEKLQSFVVSKMPIWSGRTDPTLYKAMRGGDEIQVYCTETELWYDCVVVKTFAQTRKATCAKATFRVTKTTWLRRKSK